MDLKDVMFSTLGDVDIVVLPGSVRAVTLSEFSTTGGMCEVQAATVGEYETARELHLKCNQCNKCFSQQGDLDRHNKTHTGEKRFGCNQCGKRFNFAAHLKTHETIHTGEKPFTCNQCGKGFSHKGNLNLHKITHTGVKAFKCNDCNKCFSHKGHLNEHKRIHTGEKPFSCNQCHKRFNRKSLVKQHQKTHRRENRFNQTQFDQLLNGQGSLQTLTNIHTGEETQKTSDEQDRSVNCDLGDKLETQGVILEKETGGTNLTEEPCKYKQPDAVECLGQFKEELSR